MAATRPAATSACVARRGADRGARARGADRGAVLLDEPHGQLGRLEERLLQGRDRLARARSAGRARLARAPRTGATRWSHPRRQLRRSLGTRLLPAWGWTGGERPPQLAVLAAGPTAAAVCAYPRLQRARPARALPLPAVA